MAASDASPFPIKNQAFRVTVPLFDNDGDLVTGAAGLDSEVSKDGGTFTDCTNEATELATSSGIYYLDLTASEMNADTVAVIVKTSTTDAKTTPLVLYPVTLSEPMLGVNVEEWSEGDVAAVESKIDLLDTNVDTLLARLTAARALLLDQLDNTVAGTVGYRVAKLAIALINKLVITEATGDTEQFDDSDVSIGTILAGFTSDGVTTTRKRQVQ